MTIAVLARSLFSCLLHSAAPGPSCGDGPDGGHSKPSGPDDIAGGQAVIEGVMMRHGNRIAVAVRTPAKDIVIREQDYVPLTKRYRLLGLRIIRGAVTLVEMMVLGIKTLLYSAEIALPEGEKKPQGWEIALSLCLSFGLALTLFVLIPAYCFAFLRDFIENTILLNLVEGLIRLTIFLAFLLTTLFMKDMRRVFMYHGAEHKTVFAWEHGQELTVENIKRFSTRHPRCGTSFILVVFVISILVFSLLGRPDFLARVAYKLSLFPLIAGIAYEVIRFSGKHKDKLWVQMISWPGLMLQKITTREPTDDQIEVAVAAMKKVI
ncbi:MAG TPA: DUF1385 domain-containing protein [Syntrophales bacterium]|nr:DUF1385 domain-containing protein [Syntrophobacterales bacterium]HQL91076.1 DUF1385 domain-containing protein [Syntrophales bacterium]